MSTEPRAWPPQRGDALILYVESNASVVSVHSTMGTFTKIETEFPRRPWWRFWQRRNAKVRAELWIATVTDPNG